jgi:hypothetical protein
MIAVLAIATYSLLRENAPDSWDMLALTGIDSRQFVLGKWWAVLRSMWPFLVLAALLKWGLAYALPQYLTYRRILPPYTHLEHFFFYITDYYAGMGANCYQGRSTDHTQYYNMHYGIILIMGSILLLFSLLEAALLSAIGVLSALLVRRGSTVKLALAVLLRAVLIVVAILMVQSYAIEARLRSWLSPPDASFGDWGLHRVLSTLQIAASTQMDGGMASVNLADLWITTPYAHARQYLALGLGALGYVILIGLMLWAAQKVAQRRGLLAPPEPPPECTLPD